MKAQLNRLWNGAAAAKYTALESKGIRSAPASTHAAVKLVIAVFVALLVLVFFISNNATFTWSEQGIDPPIFSKQHTATQPNPPPKPKPKPITLNCPNQTTAAPPLCQRRSPPATYPPSSSWPSPTCPEYFRWIHEDLRPWRSTGITRDMLAAARKFTTFHMVVLDGRVYVQEYFGHSLSRNVFTFWGILQLINRYPGRVPDFELVFNCMDMPSVKTAEYNSSTGPPPPLFHYCKDGQTMDILFPDWSFWGWPETNIRPWVPLMKEMKEGNAEVKWTERVPYAYWKGTPFMGKTRLDLVKCNVSKERDWNARIYAQDWNNEAKQGYNRSNLARQCSHRYRIYVEGLAWSVSLKYIMACDSPTLFIDTPYVEFFQRGLMPGRHYWPIAANNKCRAIKYAVDWGNSRPEEAQAMGKASSDFFQQEVTIDHVYDYMLHAITEYAKLLRFKPTVPEGFNEICMESLACSAPEKAKSYMLESMEKWPSEAEPCSLPPPFTPEELQQLLAKRDKVVKQVEMREQKAWEEQGNKD
ncbi:protein O-glucosyltransferase 1-like [Canna indica]|uniref:Protein O-glucosyltransferase 1-like n=1 Tax=Canna indica TaxID=4628 RepID=A0AAQ3KQT5_9LILI|nr:protein O-glucosyltransferase 1-like [Canna indica]